MHSSIPKLHALLNQLHGSDFALMTAQEIENLRVSVTNGFVNATAGLHTLLLGEYADSPRWMWSAERAESYGSELIASYTLVDTGQMEAAIGAPERVRMAAALFPALKLTIHIFAGYHHPGGTGLQVDPRISIVLDMSGDPELALVEHSLKLSKDIFPAHGSGLTIEVTPLECCCDSVQNPQDIHQAFCRIATAARNAALEENDDTTLTETVEFVLTMDQTLHVDRMEDALEYMGRLFTGVIVSQK
ncbi:hypothetical protein MCEMSEM18_03518 [Comamonadaceae bacterium]